MLDLTRRNVITLLGGAAALWPLPARAQQTKSIPRIGLLTTESPGSRHGTIEGFQKGLGELGYMEGRDIVVEYRTADGRVERFPELATELARLPVDLIVATNSLAGRAARRATSVIPIVVPVMGDPVGDGLVASLARPGGNVTGFTFLGPELLAKRVALLKEALPAISQVTALWHPNAYSERTMSDMIKQSDTAARALGLQMRPMAVDRPDGLETAFAGTAEQHTDAVLVFPSPMFYAQRRRIVDLATKHRLPLMAMDREFAELGGLIAYGASIFELVRRSTTYVDRIIKGAKPAELPVEQPTTFELVINLITAKALGVTISPTLLAIADEVIE